MLRLPPQAILCWEPQEGVATFAPLARVGMVQWRRTCPLITSERLFGDLYAPEAEHALPTHEYRMNAVIAGKEIPAVQLTSGANGGFDEACPYTVANLWLCLRKREEFAISGLMERAAAALNNILRLHSLLAADGYTRPIRPDLDSYYTLFSLARIPEDWPQLTAHALLRDRLNDLRFESKLGEGRQHNLGTEVIRGARQGRVCPCALAL